MAKYDVFISYSRKDAVVADNITKAFDDAGITYFIDRQGIGGGMEFPEILANAIKESKVFLFLASENSYKSKFTQSEIVYAFNKKQKKDIIPYIIDESSLPDALEFTFSSINWRNTKEHPVETIVEDVLEKTGKERKPKQEKVVDNEVGKAGMVSSGRYYLKLKSDIDCHFYLDGEERMVMKADKLQKIPLSPGEYVLRFVSVENPSVVQEMTFMMPDHDKFQNVSLLAAQRKFSLSSKGKKNKLPWIIGGAAVAVVALILTLVLAFSGNKTENIEEETAAQTELVSDNETNKSSTNDLLADSLAKVEEAKLAEQKNQEEAKQRKAEEAKMAEQKKKEAEQERKNKLLAQRYVDLGLPSGTLWKDKNESGFYDYDAAVRTFGGKLPTKGQLEELKNKCQWTWTGGGYTVVGPNGQSIYLPAAGYRYCDGRVGDVGSYGDYWSSTTNGSDYAWDLYFLSGGVYMSDFSRSDGRSVRLVQK